MQKTPAENFCLLTNPQPYQRDGAEPRQVVAASMRAVIRSEGVGFIDELDGQCGLNQ